MTQDQIKTMVAMCKLDVPYTINETENHFVVIDASGVELIVFTKCSGPVQDTKTFKLDTLGQPIMLYV
jgi:hypothetical protein